jgi:hypothetical protein
MRIAGGWIRIYLFYGLIFFLLGLAGSLLEGGWAEEPRLGRGLNLLFANLGKYMNPVIPGNNTIMVLAGRSRLSIRLAYSANFPGDWGGMEDKIRGLLGEAYYPVIIERIDNDAHYYQRFWSRWNEFGTDRINVELMVIPDLKLGERYRVDLGLVFPQSIKEAVSQQIESVLGGIAAYSLRQIKRDYLCRREYHWNQSGSVQPILLRLTKALAEIPGLRQKGI